jgi:2-oxoacid:acceptor oxidoreductase gamma subunit (pyruvate/2-ketoisovalerate family)
VKEEFHFRGSGGQGILSMGLVLAHAALLEGLEVSWIPSYGAERRGGTSFCAVSLSDQPIDCPISNSPTVLFVMDERAAKAFVPTLGPDATLVYNTGLVAEKPVFPGRMVSVNANEIAKQSGIPAAANIAALGAILATKGLLSTRSIEKAIAEVLGERKAKLVPANVNAFEAGAKAMMTSVISH